VSARFLAQLEAGTANISVRRLWDVAEALDTSAAALLDDVPREPRHVALIGMRGAGKTAIGSCLAARMGVRFVELDGVVAAQAGLGLAEIFELHGESYYRRLEGAALRGCLQERPRVVVATGGGIVDDGETYDLLRRETFTVWLKAAPEEHMDRVLGQGDERPMRNRANAMAELRALWGRRAPLYARADCAVDTARLGIDGSVEAILDRVAARAEA
jgi:XRE family aerobic/anaerobic benzoate catabolism transcriptional regulator